MMPVCEEQSAGANNVASALSSAILHARTNLESASNIHFLEVDFEPINVYTGPLFHTFNYPANAHDVRSRFIEKSKSYCEQMVHRDCQ